MRNEHGVEPKSRLVKMDINFGSAGDGRESGPAGPVYVEVDGQPTRSSEDAAFFMGWIDESLDWVRNEAKIPDPEQRQEMIYLFEKARKIYAAQVD